MKLYCLIQTTNNIPDLSGLGEMVELPYIGLCAPECFETMGAWRPYILTGSQEQMDAIRALPTVLGLLVTSEGDPELDEPVDEVFRQQVNTITGAYGKPELPEGSTNREMVA